MSTTLRFDDGASRRLESLYTTPDVISQRTEVLAALALQSGERVLDIGSGPGFLALEMADAVGPSGRICAIDSSESMVTMTRTRCAHRDWVEVRIGASDVLPFGDCTFDVVVATQVLEYVADVKKSLREAFRVLRPGGKFLALDTDWDSIVWHSTDRLRMTRILEAWEEHLNDPRLPRILSSLLRETGFLRRRRKVISLLNVEYDRNTYSYGLISLILAFVPGRKGIDHDEAQSWAADLQTLGETDAYFFSLNRYLFLSIRPTV